MFSHEAGHSVLVGSRRERHFPSPMNSALGGHWRKSGALCHPKRCQRTAASRAHKVFGSGALVPTNVIRSGEMPSPVSASPIERKEEPLRPGPSSTTRKWASAPVCEITHLLSESLSFTVRSYGCPIG